MTELSPTARFGAVPASPITTGMYDRVRIARLCLPSFSRSALSTALLHDASWR